MPWKPFDLTRPDVTGDDTMPVTSAAVRDNNNAIAYGLVCGAVKPFNLASLIWDDDVPRALLFDALGQAAISKVMTWYDGILTDENVSYIKQDDVRDIWRFVVEYDAATGAVSSIRNYITDSNNYYQHHLPDPTWQPIKLVADSIRDGYELLNSFAVTTLDNLHNTLVDQADYEFPAEIHVYRDGGGERGVKKKFQYANGRVVLTNYFSVDADNIDLLQYEIGTCQYTYNADGDCIAADWNIPANPYEHYAYSDPGSSIMSIQEWASAQRRNANALTDAILIGQMPGANFLIVSSGDDLMPEQYVWELTLDSPPRRLVGTPTWAGAGVAWEGYPDSVQWDMYQFNGSDWVHEEALGVVDIAWNDDLTFSGIAWRT